ncbi:MAG TPA: hypothetical protein VFR08_06495 [Candidatus Angelobacter sp.]|nr:hypothetical protein [Candidatus Angelobacter sp.]
MNKIHGGNFAIGSAVRNTARGLLVTLVAFMATGMASAQADSNDPNLLKFKGGIGVIPVTGVAANGAVNLNVVRGVNPGVPWRIADLQAAITPDGHIKVAGRGLLLASTNGLGTNAGQSVHATLFCGPAARPTASNSTLPGVALAADGDFVIDDFLSPPPPVPCDSPVLLIRNVGGVWFAAGIPNLSGVNQK